MSDQIYPVKKKEELILRVEKLAFGGKGIARINDYVIFVENSLPGDLLKVKIFHRKPNYAQARILEIVESSPLRQEAPCPYFRWCGGCTWQNLTYIEQLRIKGEQVAESISHITGITGFEHKETLASVKIWAYRNKMEFSFSNRRWLLPEELNNDLIKKDFALGLHIPGTFDKILQIDYCMLQSESANNVLKIVDGYCRENQLQPYDLHSQKGYLRFLVIRQSNYTSEIMVNIVTLTKEPELLADLAKRLRNEIPEVSSVVNTINRQKAQIALGQDEVLLSGKKYISDKIGNFVFKISASSFFQTNTVQAEQLYSIVLDYTRLKGDEVVWDLYAGTGTISLFLAQKAKYVYAFEIMESAVHDGIKNAKQYDVKNIEFVAGDLLKNLSEVKEAANVIVVDPPRSGMHPKVCKFLSECKADRLVYVSCNPTTMARDLVLLLDNFRIIKIKPVDMFPHTYHIETVCLLERI